MSSFRSLLKKTRSGTANKVKHLVFGTFSAQLILLATMPILTRLYSKEEFGIYGAFLSIAGVATVFSTFCYERGIVTAHTNFEKHSIFRLAILCSIFSIPVTFAIFSVWSGAGISDNSPVQHVISSMPFILALAICLNGLENSFTHLALKQQDYGILGLCNTTRSASQVALQLFFVALFLLPGMGLIAGAVLAPAIVTFLLFTRYIKKTWSRELAESPTLRDVGKAAIDNYIYPKYMVWSALFNSMTNHSLILIVGGLFSLSAAGSVFLAYRILMLPIKLLGKNISQVNLQESSELTREEVCLLYKRRVALMLLVGAGPLVITLVTAPWIFPFVFGEEWNQVGIIAQILAPGIYFQFVFMPFLSLFTALKEQRAYLFWSVARLTLIIIGLYAGSEMAGLYGAVTGFVCALIFSYVVAHFLLLSKLRPVSGPV